MYQPMSDFMEGVKMESVDKWFENIGTVFNLSNISEWQKNYLKGVASVEHYEEKITDEEYKEIKNRIKKM